MPPPQQQQPGGPLLKVLLLLTSAFAVLWSLRISDERRHRARLLRRVMRTEEPRQQPTVAVLSSSWQWDSVQAVAALFQRLHPSVRVIVERDRDPAGRMETLWRTQGVRCFLSGTSEGHVRRILPFLRATPEVLVVSPTSTATPDSFEGGLPRNFVRVTPHDGAVPNVVGKCVVHEVLRRIRRSAEQEGGAAKEAAATVPRPAAETRHLFDSLPVQRIAAAGLLVDGAEQQPEPPPPEDDLAALRTVAVLHLNNIYGQGLARVLRRQLPPMNLGMALRFVPFDAETLPERARLLERMVAEERLAAVVYVGFGSDLNRYAGLCRELPALRGLPHVLCPATAFDQDLLRNPDAPALMANAYCVVYFGEPGSEKRYAALAADLGAAAQAGPAAALQQDALSLLLLAERAGGGHEELHRAARGFVGVTGQIRLDSRGDRIGGSFNLVTTKEVLGAAAWKPVGTRSVLGTAEVRLAGEGGGVHTLVGSKLEFAHKSLPVSRVLRAVGVPECAGRDCSCAPGDRVEIVSRDLYGNALSWTGGLSDVDRLQLHAADRTTIRVGCTLLLPSFQVRVMPVRSDADAIPVFYVPDHAGSSADVREVVVL